MKKYIKNSFSFEKNEFYVKIMLNNYFNIKLMQNYNKIQKFISFFLIFSILFSFTVNIKFFGFIWTIMASDTKYYNLVSIFVQDDIYSDIKNEVNTYAKNIQNNIENTKTIIIPTSKTEHPFNIASVNEKLYFEWESWFFWNKWNSKLIGSVFIWDLSLPVVENNGSFEKTIFPYVDFDDKLYIYNHEEKRYKINTETQNDPKAEIWHWFISPNSGDTDTDIQQIKDYFSKNNDYYNWVWNFKNSQWITNGKQDEELIQKYEPSVFYYDQFRETKAVKYVDYKAYEGFLNNMEDITYNRFSKELSEKLKENYFGSQKDFIWDVSKIIWNGPDVMNALSWPTTNNVPDIQTRHIIQNTTKKFLQIFNESTLWDFRKDVHNAWRYNSGSSQVNVDFIPYLLTNIDWISQAVIKNVNSDLENYIDNLVKKWLSRDIAIPNNFVLWWDTYTNFLYWNQSKNISTAVWCTIYRWSTYNSGNLVEASRWFNINLVGSDVWLCNTAETNWYWGWYSPVNINPDITTGDTLWKLKSSNYKNAIVPLYDIIGALKSKDTSKNPDPRSCFDNNLILSTENTVDDLWWKTLKYQIPINWLSASNWSCSTTNKKLWYTKDFTETYKSFPKLGNDCIHYELNLDTENIFTISPLDCTSTTTGTDVDGNTTTETTTKPTTDKIYNFHKINSWIEHKSPNSDELLKQTQYMISPNLPIDKDRYIDFIWADNIYWKINYPYLFRIILDENKEFDIENAKISLKKYLDEKSVEINNVINSRNPSKLGWVDATIYGYLKTGTYPTANIDLYNILENKPKKQVEILGSKKTLSYIDTLIFSVYWNNLNSVGWKYKFIMENYLSDQFGGNEFNFFLPKNKKQYEMSYLWAPWDAKNMYVKLDPEDKGENPYANIIANNLKLNSALLWNNGKSKKDNKWNFKCAPPEWVPIWQWIPAVMCRLWDILPPKISLTDWNCWLSLISSGKDDGSFWDNSDINKNWINDFLEEELKKWKLELKTDASKYYYNRVWKLEGNLLNASGSNILFDNSSNVIFELLKVEIPNDTNKAFDETNKKTIYHNVSSEKTSLNNKDAYDEALKYVFFKDLKVMVQQWKAVYSFVTKSNDANVTFKATLILKDQKWNIVIQKDDTKIIQIRWDLSYATNYKLSKYLDEFTLDSWINSVIASDSQNIFLIEDTHFNSLKSSLWSLGSLSNSKDKMFISLINNDKKWNSLPIEYPINIRLVDENWKVKKEETLNQINGTYSLWSFKESGSYILEIKDRAWSIIKKEIEIIPDIAIKIEPNLSTTLLEKWWVITTNAFTIFDKFWNPTIGDTYQVEASISWDSLTFEDGNKKMDFQVLEWYKPFRLKTTLNWWSAHLTLRLKNAEILIEEKTVSLVVVDKINFEINWLPNEIKVWNNIYDYNLNIINNSEFWRFNSRAYLVSNGLYVNSNQEYIDVKNNSGTGSFETTTKAWEKVKLEFKIEWVRDSLYKEINILPDLPIKIDLWLSKSKIEADKNNNSNLYVDLKDKFNNIVWNDNSTSLTLEILEKYKHIIKSANKVVTVKKWKWIFILNATNIPGTAFFKVSTTPDLSNNKIEFIWQSPFVKSKIDGISGMRASSILTDTGKIFFEEYDLDNYRFKFFDRNILQSNEVFQTLNPLQKTQILNLYDSNNTLILPWVWENAGKIETFYFWNKDKINGKKYNSIYTTLLGSNYWDITVKDNVANSILFDKNNRSLAISALLNNLDKNIEVLNIKPDGNIALNVSSSDLSQDITTNVNIDDAKKLEIVFYNNTFWNLVSKIYINLKNTIISPCNSWDIKDCIKEDKNKVSLKSLDNNYTVDGNETSNLSLIDKEGVKLLEISKDGTINKNIFTQLEISKNYTDWLVFDVKYNGKIVWNFAIKFKTNSKQNFIRDINTLPTTLNAQENGWIVIYLEARDYYFTQKYLWSSTKENIWYTISYNDPFGSSWKKLNSFATNFWKWYESFATDKAIWWEDENKTLLSFAAGKNVWDATKDYMSFSLINIWDPVVSLKQIKKQLPWTPKDRKFDSTIWYLISKDTNNIGYSTFDYNDDSITDIVLLKKSWYIELLEWTNDIKNFINRGNLIYLADLWTKPTIETWDFNGDGYDDIIVLNKNRQPVLLNNNTKDFTRINLNLKLNGIISQIISYDMDLDGKSDIVTLDDSWEINIHYGTTQSAIFTKSKIDSWLGININGWPRKDLGAIYFDSLYQIPENKTQDYIKESQELLSKEKSGTADQNDFNEWLVDKLIFTQMNYGGLVTSWDNKEDMLNNLPDLSSLKTWWLDVDNWAITNFVTTISEDLNPGKNEYDSLNISKVSTFLKSEYAEHEWLNIEKRFTDDNGNPLKWGDKIRLDIKITNNSDKVINNIAYVDKIPQPFKLSSNMDYTLNVGWKEIDKENIMLKPSPSDDFSLLLDSYKEWNNVNTLSLQPGKSIYLWLFLDTNAFQYWYIEAGLFNDQTNHWDIIFKTKNENCWKPFNLYKSTALRDLEKFETAWVCKNELPDSIKDNAVDVDDNWVPDYIDKLVNWDPASSWLVDYAKDKLGNFNKDTDQDGLVDREEMSPGMSNEEDFMNSLGSVNVNVDKIMAWIDVILDGLSCWFWWPGCIASPINRAPLAPWQDLAVLWLPTGDGLNIWEWLPIFSALNWKQVWNYCLPMPWPPWYNLPGCSGKWAWGRIGPKGWSMSPTNFVRLFITPTLTGSIWIAVCFWAPASVVWNIPPQWVSPFVPGWNCIVAAVPVGCKNDGSEWEINNKGNPNSNVINGNCSWDDNMWKVPYLWNTAKEYLNYKKTWVKSMSLKDSLKDAFSKVAKKWSKWQTPSSPLLNVAWGWEEFDMEVDFSALKNWNFEDVLKIKMPRISPFPDFIMEWVTRQIEEIANKLTDFPTLYVILPDFDGVMDSGWGNFIENMKKQFSEWEQKAEWEQNKLQWELDSKEKEAKWMDCEKDQIWCYLNTAESAKLQAKKNIWSNKTVWWVKAAYEFMSNLPIISIQTQKVNFNLPWVDKKTIDKALRNFEFTKQQRTEELARAKAAWDVDNYTSVWNNWSTDKNWNKAKVAANTQGLINSIDKNIEILNDYKRLPEKIHKMLKIKEIRINQILCNIETISKITGWRIWDNWKRFKAWVELYVLIKAILKSWQLLVDVFIDYSAECHQCKNERRDLMYFVWKMISAAMPKIPIIQFPKWPDIYLDLHNIRVQLNIWLPEYEFNLRPLLIPPLPRLYLPDSPNVNINLPTLPLLPKIDLMELPDLPSLPKIELPNLPPPPKLPKLLSSIEIFLDILKIITKVMCILKTSPFVPEWRAGDQIAFISERWGHLSLDFLDISLPQFSFPFIDAIKVTTFVNLEIDIDFLVEMSRQTALPLNIFTNDIVKMLNIGIGDLDFRDALPFSEVDVWVLGWNKTSFNTKTIKTTHSDKKITLDTLARFVVLNIVKLHGNIDKDSKILLSNEEFKQSIWKQLSNISNEKIVWVWENALNYSFTKEDLLIQELIKNNENKFNELKSILNEEKLKSSKIIQDLEKKLEEKPTENLFMNSLNTVGNNYNSRLEQYNLKAVKSIKNLFTQDTEVNEIRNDSKEILNTVKNWLSSFSDKLDDSKKAFENIQVNNVNKSLPTSLAYNEIEEKEFPVNNNTKLLADSTIPLPMGWWSNTAAWNCMSSIGGYSYVYKWIYIVEEFLSKKISYLLFDYIDELNGKEKFIENDFDGDNDKDIIYMVWNELYIKENLIEKKIIKQYYSGNPILLNKEDNKMYNNDFIESVNGLKESISDNGYINVKFSDSNRTNISNYKIEFYEIIDKFDDVMNGLSATYIPKKIKKYIIDGFRDIDEITLDLEKNSDSSFVIRKNLAYINSVWGLAWVNIKTKEIKNLTDDIKSNKEITINAGTKIYSASDWVKLTYYFYKDKDNEFKLKNINVNSYSNIEFNEDIILVWLSNDAYVEWKWYVYLTGNSIITYVKKPIIPGTKIEYIPNELSNSTTSFVSIKYYDGSITDVDFSEAKYYELYDLWNKSDAYLLRTSIENNFYYVKAQSFKNNKFSTLSDQILLSPQKESDTKAPEITNLSSIKAPVYQKRIIDVSEYIFEDSGIKNIKDIYIDSDLDIDTNNNGDPYDDKNYQMWKTSTGINIQIEGNKILFNVWPFDKLYDKKVRIHITDANNNTWYKDVWFLIYSPIPTITNVINNKIEGKLDEWLVNEPTSFYRIRWGSIDKLIDKNALDIAKTIEMWKFNFNLWVESWLEGGVELNFSGSKLLKVDETTGKITISDFDKAKYKLDYKVYASNNKNNDSAYPKIMVLKDNVPIYYQYISTPNIGKVEVTDNFVNLNKIWVYYKHGSENYEYFQVPLWVTTNAWDLFIYESSDTTKNPIFKIFKDGRIYVWNETYYLEYDTWDKYVIFNLKKVWIENTIWKVMIIPEQNFILK